MKKIISFCIAVVLLSPLIYADTVTLKNGKAFKGNIKSETKEGVWLEIENMGEVFFHHIQIKQIKKRSQQEKEKRIKEKQGLIKQQKAKGLVEHKGRWVTKEEKDILLKEKEQKKQEKEKILMEKYEIEVKHAKKRGKIRVAIQNGEVVPDMTTEEVARSVGQPYKITDRAWIYGYVRDETTAVVPTKKDGTGFPVDQRFFYQTLKIVFNYDGIVESVDDTIQKTQLEIYTRPVTNR